MVIDPCEVVLFDPPADLDVTYTIEPESTLMAIEYNFAQSPCSYTGTYRASLLVANERSTTLPSFITAYKDKPLLTVYTIDWDNVGTY